MGTVVPSCLSGSAAKVRLQSSCSGARPEAELPDEEVAGTGADPAKMPLERSGRTDGGGETSGVVYRPLPSV